MAKTGTCSNCGATFAGRGTVTCPVCGMPYADGDELAVRPRPRPDPSAARAHVEGQVRARTPQAAGIVVAALVALVAATAVVGVTLTRGESSDGTAAPVDDPMAAVEPPMVGEAATEGTPQEQDVPATARFDFHAKRPSVGDTFYVLGEVENTSPFAIRKPELVIILVDENGNEVGTDSGFALAEILEPGEKSYLSAVVTSPPPHHDLKFEMAPRKATYRPRLAQGLRVEAMAPQKRELGMYKFAGSVKNDGQTSAKFVNVCVLAFDAEAKLMGVYSSYAKTDSLAPGQSARFSVTGVGLEPEPARVEYSVSAQVAD